MSNETKMRRSAVATLVVALAVALAGCGDDDGSAAQPTLTEPGGAIELTIVYDDGAGTRTTGALTCRGSDQRAEGALRGRASAARLCAHARGIAGLLTTRPDRRRACAQIYGGPETAHVTGTIGRERVDRRFTRTNGCAIADFTRAAGLLQP